MLMNLIRRLLSGVWGTLRGLAGVFSVLWSSIQTITATSRNVPLNDDEKIAMLELKLKHLLDKDKDKPAALDALGELLRKRFGRTGNIADIERSITSQEHAVMLSSETNPYKPAYLNDLGDSLRTRFNRFGDIGDLHRAISLQEQSVLLSRDGHPAKAMLFGNLGTLLLMRFHRMGDISDLGKAIVSQENAVRLTPDGDITMPKVLNNLGNSFAARFRCLGELSDLENAITYRKLAAELPPDGHPDRLRSLFNLGTSLQERFERFGDIADIETAISYQDEAVQATPDSHRDKPSYLNNLGNSLQERFKHLGEILDLEKAIMNHEFAVLLTPDQHLDKPRFLINLATTLYTRFKRFGDITDIEDAVKNTELALLVTSDGHPDKPGFFSNLGMFLLTRYERSGETIDIEKAISNQEHAVNLTSDTHPSKPALLGALGILLDARFNSLRNISDLDKAIESKQFAVILTPEGHRDMAHRLHNLANQFVQRFEQFNDTDSLKQAILNYSASAHHVTGQPSVRFHSAMEWSKCARMSHDNDGVLEAYTLAFELLPMISWHGMSIASRHHELLAANSLACDSAAAAFSAGNIYRALEWLEQGRSVVWGQVLQLRMPIDDLRDVDLSLAENISQIALSLEQHSPDVISVGNGREEASEQAVQRHRRLADEWESLLKQARRLKGFERFLLPKQYVELRKAAHNGPVVVLNVSEYGCDALILVSPSRPASHVPLRNLTYGKAENLRKTLYKVLNRQGYRHEADERHGGQVFDEHSTANDAFRFILEELWILVVEPVLVFLESQQAHSLPHDGYFHVTWCPTGPLAFLPIHAAGIYNADGTAFLSLPDVAISSYTPTLNALLNRNINLPTKETPPFKLLAVIQPNAPGATSLPGTTTELKYIQKHVPPSSIRILGGSNGTTSQVLAEMEECTWVHMACHGVQDSSHPMESGLLLHDGRLHLSRIIQKHLSHAEFAFLSACQTATGDQNRPEEAIHLAAGMLLAGYRGVVATMWSIQDDDAPFVADRVYSRLLKDGQPSGVRPVVALNEAIHELRKRNGTRFSSWVPFIYMGV